MYPIMADLIRTTSGKTARAHIADLRQRRVPIPQDQTSALINQLDALADQAYMVIRMMREQGNALRVLAVEAKQTVNALRKRQKLDLEL